MQVIVDDLATSYVRSGSGRTVVLLHGWGESSATWRVLAGNLSKHYDVVALDLSGFGGSDEPSSDWDVTDYAKFVQHFLKKLEVQPYGLIGHSHGGAVAVRGVGTGLLNPKKLVLLASAGIRGDQKGRKRALSIVAKTGKLLAKPLPNKTQAKLREKLYASAGSDLFVAPRLEGTFKKVVTDDVQADAAKVGVPTLLIYGEDDTATPVRYGELFHEAIEGSTLEVLPGAGHFVHHDRPADVLQSIEDFLK